MMKLIKVIDEQTKKCEVALNENPDEETLAYYTEQGFVEGDWEKGYDGLIYVKGYAPAKPQNIINAERIAELQDYLDKTDWYAVRFAETGVEIPEDIKAARQSAREEISHLRGDDDQNTDPGSVGH